MWCTGAEYTGPMGPTLAWSHTLATHTYWPYCLLLFEKLINKSNVGLPATNSEIEMFLYGFYLITKYQITLRDQ